MATGNIVINISIERNPPEDAETNKYYDSKDIRDHVLGVAIFELRKRAHRKDKSWKGGAFGYRGYLEAQEMRLLADRLEREL